MVMAELLHNMWSDDQGQDIAEYALMAAVILIVVIGAVKAIGTTASSIFTSVNLALYNN
jgi:Flp pilus assembly pilin Flp